MQDLSSSALDQIRAQLRLGRRRPGEPLCIKTLAQQLKLSPTPVREALARLAGEGLVLERRGLGYFVEGLDAQGLVELLGLHELYVVFAVQSPRRRVGPVQVAPGRLEALEADPVAATECLFATLVEAPGGTVLPHELRRVADRLAASRRAEAHLLGSPIEALRALARLTEAPDPRGLIAAIRRFHQIRADLAPDVIAVMRGNTV